MASRNRSTHIASALAALTLLAPAPVGAQALPGAKTDNPDSIYFVKNNTRVTLICRTQLNDGKWSKWFRFRSGRQFAPELRQSGEKREVNCRPPARNVSYRIKSGERYAFVARNDRVLLIQIK